jgi:hypothetical protein
LFSGFPGPTSKAEESPKPSARIQRHSVVDHGGAVTDTRAGDLDADTVAPWIAWGPYLWADGTVARSDGLTWLPGDVADGTHPSASGIARVGSALMQFFLDSPYSRCWFRAPSQHARCDLSG